MIHRDTYRVIWSDEDGEYAVLCAEFPWLSWLAATPDTALAGSSSRAIYTAPCPTQTRRSPSRS